MILAVVSDLDGARVLGQGTLGNVDAHAADVEGRVGPPALDSRASGHFVVHSAGNQLLVKLVVQRTAALIAVQGIVQTRRVQVVVRVLERQQTVLWKKSTRISSLKKKYY